MKYCQKCGNKLNEKSNFCSKCGNKISTTKKKISTTTNEEKKEKLLLILGMILIIVSSIIFAFANWNEMSSIFKILFLSVESLLFLAMSLFSKKLNYKMPYKFLWFIGIIFIPIIFHLIALDKVLGNYLSYDGNGIYVYLSICSFICAVLYFISYKVIKSNIFIYIAYVFLYMLFISILGIFNITKFNIMLPILNGFNLLLCILYILIKNVNYKKTLNIFISVILILFSILTVIYAYSDMSIILQIITYITMIISLLLLIFKTEKNIVIYCYPIMIYFVITNALSSIFNGYTNVISFVSILSIILINFISNLKDNKYIKNISFIFMILYEIFILLIHNADHITLCIDAVVILVSLIFIIKITSEEVQKVISKLLLPIYSLVIIYSLITQFLNINISYIYLIVSIVFYSIYIIFNQKKFDKMTKNIFEIASYVVLSVTTLIILSENVSILAFILSELLWLYYFIVSKVIKRNKALNILLLIALIINFLLLSLKYSLPFYYSLLFISLITSILDFIEYKINNKKSIFIYISIIVTALASFNNFKNIAIIGICFIVLLYIFTYYMAVKKHNIKFIVKYLYTLVGFILINSIYNYFINTWTLANILVLATFIVIIISMFLLEVDDDNKVLSYSIVIIYPYLNLVDSIPILNKYSITLISILAVSLVLIYFERVFKLKEDVRDIFELIFLIIIHLTTVFKMILFNFIFATFYIFYGFYKKRKSFVILGSVLLIVSLVFNVVNIFNNITVTYVLLLIGIIMLAYVFYIEGKKNNKK